MKSTDKGASKIIKEHKDFDTTCSKASSFLSQYGPTFLPPIDKHAKEKYDKLEVIHEEAKHYVKGISKDPTNGIQFYSSL